MIQEAFEEGRRRVVRLMLARLGLALAVLVATLLVIGAGRDGAEAADRGLYGTLAFAFLATALFGACTPFVRHIRRFAALQVATDIGIVTSLVLFSGGVDSIFSFLYLPIPVYGAIFLARTGAYGSATLASLCYGGALFLVGPLGLAGGLRAAPAPPTTFGLWVFHTGALLLAALLSSALAREIRLAGERLHESASDLKSLQRLHERTVESLTSGLLTLDPEGHVMSFNPEAERITGLRPEQALGRSLDEVLPGASDAVTESARGPARTRTRMLYVAPGGAERHLGLASSVLRDSEGEPSGRVVIFQDVTDVVAMESELRRSSRVAAVGQLAADIAHEIRNPLAAISGSVEMLTSGPGEDREDRERGRLRGIVLREIERLDQLITDFLLYARPAPAKPVPVDLVSVVAGVAEMLEASRPESIRLETEVTQGTWVLADGDQLRQVLWNLVVNALQASPEGGCIRIEGHPLHSSQGRTLADRNDAKEGARSVEIVVSDTGSGIEPELLERIFDPFFTTKGGGTGLGLATVHRIVESNSGTLHVASRLGRGSEFRIHLPFASAPQSPENTE